MLREKRVVTRLKTEPPIAATTQWLPFTFNTTGGTE